MAFDVAVSTIGRTVVRPYISPRIILTQAPLLAPLSRRLRLSPLRAIRYCFDYSPKKYGSLIFLG
jgi:hypothetical protein